MKVDFRESFFYEAWIVMSNFGTQNSYRIYIKVLDPGRPEIAGKQTGRPANLFANKHLRDDAAGTLRKRTFKGATEYEKWDALETLGVKLNPHLEPVRPPSTNTAIDFEKIDKKLAAYLVAKALLEGMLSGKFGDYKTKEESEYCNHFEIDFNGIPCVVSAGKQAGVASKMQVGAKRISKLNPQNQVSFDVNHCAGAVSAPVTATP
ncbi:MAG: hypothetical protein WB586_02255 [Chthoniobacterales bacterium]|jgi:hypothetical protein